MDPRVITKDWAMVSQVSSVFQASDGAAYELWLGRWSTWLANVFLDFVDFPDNGELLDVGCGTGALTLAMVQQRWPARRVIGVDQAANRFGIPIPSTDPVFLAVVGVHVAFGLAAVIAGAVAMLSQKGRGRHSNLGTIYFWLLIGVFVTMSNPVFHALGRKLPPVCFRGAFICVCVFRARCRP